MSGLDRDWLIAKNKEGNTELLALENAISSLAGGDKDIPYDDSKLIRLLFDGSGSSRHLLLLACVSPADVDCMKTLNTLKYASRARNQVNNHRELDLLQNQVSQLKMQSGAEKELEKMRKLNQEMANELSQVRTQRDTVMAQQSSDHIDDTHPLIKQYVDSIQMLRLQLAEAQSRLAYFESSSSSSSSLITIPGRTSTSMALPGRYGNMRYHREDSRFLHRLGVTLSGRRPKCKFVPVSHRMKKRPSASTSCSNNNNKDKEQHYTMMTTVRMRSDSDETFWMGSSYDPSLTLVSTTTTSRRTSIWTKGKNGFKEKKGKGIPDLYKLYLAHHLQTIHYLFGHSRKMKPWYNRHKPILTRFWNHHRWMDIVSKNSNRKVLMMMTTIWKRW